MKIKGAFLLALYIIAIIWGIYVTVGFINEVIFEGMLEPWFEINMLIM